MGLLDFDFDFSVDTRESVRTFFDLAQSIDKLESAGMHIPAPGNALRMISPAGGWSSCSLILWIAEQTHIRRMIATTLRVGKKEIDAICGLMYDGTLESAEIYLSGIAKQHKKYDYSDYFEAKCEEYGIKYKYVKNHSKVILLDTDLGKIVIETSSNLNENPKIEQFCVLNSEKVYDFYMNCFNRLGVRDGN